MLLLLLDYIVIIVCIGANIVVMDAIVNCCYYCISRDIIFFRVVVIDVIIRAVKVVVVNYI